MTNQELKVTNMPTIPNEKTWPHKLRKFINKKYSFNQTLVKSR